MVTVNLTEDEVLVLLRALTVARAANEAVLSDMLGEQVDRVCLRRDAHMRTVENALMEAAGLRVAR